MKEKQLSNDNVISLETRVAILEERQVNLATGISDIKNTLIRLETKTDNLFIHVDEKVESLRSLIEYKTHELYIQTNYKFDRTQTHFTTEISEAEKKAWNYFLLGIGAFLGNFALLAHVAHWY